jgi:TatD DNase family protein
LPASPDGRAVNHPGNIEAAYTGLASLLGLGLADLSAQVAQNFTRFFGARD